MKSPLYQTSVHPDQLYLHYYFEKDYTNFTFYSTNTIISIITVFEHFRNNFAEKKVLLHEPLSIIRKTHVSIIIKTVLETHIHRLDLFTPNLFPLISLFPSPKTVTLKSTKSLITYILLMTRGNKVTKIISIPIAFTSIMAPIAISYPYFFFVHIRLCNKNIVTEIFFSNKP